MSIFVSDQDAALAFYTDVLGFVPADDIPMGEYRWLTVASAEDPHGMQISLEPAEHPAVGPFREALVADGIPFTSFEVDDVDTEYRRLTALGVGFTQPPVATGPLVTAVFDDTCGNLIQIASMGSQPQ
jgi:catechol 2,3-dioxygenase-like lactoylglutathione lyase family enzyme